jgi:hypothetical protein
LAFFGLPPSRFFLLSSACSQKKQIAENTNGLLGILDNGTAVQLWGEDTVNDINRRWFIEEI